MSEHTSYDIKIYTTVRRKPYNLRVRDVDAEEVFGIIKRIEETGIKWGQFEFYGVWLSPKVIKFFKWYRVLRIMKWLYWGEYLNKDK